MSKMWPTVPLFIIVQKNVVISGFFTRMEHHMLHKAPKRITNPPSHKDWGCYFGVAISGVAIGVCYH